MSVLLRPPSALWGYNVQVTDEALNRIAQVITERDVEIAVLRQQLAELRSATGSHPAIAATVPPAAGRAPVSHRQSPGHRRHPAGPLQGGQCPGLRYQEASPPSRYLGNQCWPGWIAGRGGAARRPAGSALAGTGDLPGETPGGETPGGETPGGDVPRNGVAGTASRVRAASPGPGAPRSGEAAAGRDD